MRLSLLIIFVAAVISLQFKHVSNQSEHNPFPQNIEDFNGEWELIQVEQSGKIIKAESLNECGYKELIHLKFNDDLQTFNYGKTVVKGYDIGRSNEKSCSFDPETFEPVIANNSCYNTLIRSETPDDEWYEMGEGILAKYKVSMDTDSLLILKTQKVFVSFEKTYSKKVFKRIKK